MLWTKLFLPTLREAPAGISSAGGRLLARAGYCRGDAHLFLGQRSLRRIARIVREELDSLGAQELSVPSNQPMTALARELRSYKQLPQIWYQSAGEFEIRCFGIGKVDLQESFRTIFRRCGIECLTADAPAGARFVVASDSGQDSVARAGTSIADLAGAACDPKPPQAPDLEGDHLPALLYTPHRKTIAELAAFTGLPDTSHIKSLVMADANGALVMALLRGDHQLSEVKLARVLGATGVRPANPDEIRRRFGAGAGSLGPVGVAAGVRILTDEALRGRRNMIAGANRDDYHLRHVTPGEDFPAEYFDLRLAAAGDTIHGEPLRIEPVVTLAAVSYEVPSGDLHVTGADGIDTPLSVGCSTLSIEQVLWAAAEQHNDPDGLAMPPEIAPFDLIVTPVDASNATQRSAAQDLAAAAAALGLEVLIDDRDERPGVKFKDADLTGIPWRVTIGKKLEQGIVEVVDRQSKQKHDVAVGDAVEFIRTRR